MRDGSSETGRWGGTTTRSNRRRAPQGATSGERPHAWIGRLLGDKLRLLRELERRDGFALFEAENTLTLRRVAVKLLADDDARSRARARRFLHEARSGARIHHPNVVDVFDLGEDAATGALFVVQELLRGVTLEALLQERGRAGLRPAECAGIVLPIAEALEAAHQLGLAHGDVSTTRIFLARRGAFTVPKLLDLGLGGAPDPASVTATHTELAEQRFARAARADVGAIGRVLRDCLAGADGPDDAALDEAPRDEVHPELAAIAVRALFAPEQGGFATMTELVRALRATRAHARHVADTGDLPLLALGTSSAPPPPELTPVIERLSWAPPIEIAPLSPPPRRVGERPLRRGRARFGLVLADLAPAQQAAVRAISAAVRSDVKVIGVAGHAELIDALAEGVIDLAWLPPVTYVRARRAGAARLMLAVERDGSRSYSSALVVRGDSPARSVRDLRDLRAAWVGPWSAAGFLIPRRMLRGAGLEPDGAFRAQTAVGSYAEVLRALIDGDADVGAAWCRLGAAGEIAHGAFGDDPRVRVLAISADPIPGDAICASSTLAIEAARDVAARFVRAAQATDLVPHFRALLSKDRLVAANPSRYEALERALLEDLHADALGEPPAPRAARVITRAWEAAPRGLEP